MSLRRRLRSEMNGLLAWEGLWIALFWVVVFYWALSGHSCGSGGRYGPEIW